jgi:translation initiation factor 5A
MSTITQNHPSSAPTRANASLTTPTQAFQLRKDGYVLIQNNACRITELKHCRPSNHGHPKAIITAIEIFTGKEHNEIRRGHKSVDVPTVTKKEYLVLDIDGGYLSLWDPERGEPKDDIKVPDGEVGEKVVEMWKRGEKDIWVMVLGAMGMEIVDGAKEAETEQ